MTEFIVYAALILLLLATAASLLRAPREGGAERREHPAEFFPVHCRYFPQMRLVFSPEDAAFLEARGSRSLVRRWKADRRRAARMYLKALQQDFAGLNRLARMLARHSAHLDARQQAQVLWLSLWFQLLYRVALAQIFVGLPAAWELHHMTRLVGSLSGRLEKAALTLEQSSAALIP